MKKMAYVRKVRITKGLSVTVWYFKRAKVPKFGISKGHKYQSLVFQNGGSDKV